MAPGISTLTYLRHNFKMAAMTSFHSELCCCLVSTHAAYSHHLCSNALQFLVYSTFVLVDKTIEMFAQFTCSLCYVLIDEHLRTLLAPVYKDEGGAW